MLSNAAANPNEQRTDIAMRMHPPAEGTLVQRKVGELVLGFLAHRGYLRRRGVPVDLVDLAQHDVIGSDRTRADLQRAEAMDPPAALARVVPRTDGHPARVAFARACLGLILLHGLTGPADPVLLPVLPDLRKCRLPIFVVTHRDLRAVRQLRATFDHLADEFARYARG